MQSALVFTVVLNFLCLTSGQKSQYKAKYSKEPQHVPHFVEKQHVKTKKCPEGYWLEGGQCINKDEVPFTNICPPGTVEEGGKCLKFEPTELICPVKQHLFGTDCIGVDEAPYLHFCPPGTEEKGNHCILILKYPLTCPDGSALVDGKCVVVIPIIKKCPPHYQPLGDVCVKKEELPPYPECPLGLPLEHDKCIFKWFLDPVCPKGTQEGFGKCATFHRKISKCADGYIQKGKECEKILVVPKQISCANGKDPANNCKEKIPVPLTPFCPPPMKLVHDQCEFIERLPASYTCPPDYHLKGTSCVKTIEYDCSITNHEVKCEEPPKPSKEGHGFGLRELVEFKKPKIPAHPPHIPILPVCHKVPILIPKTCTKEVTAEATPFCAVGVYKGGSICEVIQYKPPLLKCDAIEEKGLCFVVEASNPIKECPPGYSGGIGMECTKIDTTPLMYFCPPNTDGPFCATYHEKICPHGGCEKILIVKPTLLCPEGYILKEGSKSAPVCVKPLFKDLVEYCPDRTEQHGLACLKFLQPIQKVETREIPLIVVCPPGYKNTGSQCLKDIFSPATPHCPPEWQIDGALCVFVIHRNKVCPKGSVAEKGKCWVFNKTEALVVDTVVEKKKPIPPPPPPPIYPKGGYGHPHGHH